MPYPDSEYPSITRGKDKRESERLLAAAPELLAACKKLRALVQDIDRAFSSKPGVIFDAMSAIVKAEGRE